MPDSNYFHAFSIASCSNASLPLSVCFFVSAFLAVTGAAGAAFGLATLVLLGAEAGFVVFF